jgi:hypothetical protein
MNQERERISFVGPGPLGMPIALDLLHGIQGKMDCCVIGERISASALAGLPALLTEGRKESSLLPPS